jgi:hypothetical protein
MKTTKKEEHSSWIRPGGGGRELQVRITKFLFTFMEMETLESKEMVYQKHPLIRFITLQRAMKVELGQLYG